MSSIRSKVHRRCSEDRVTKLLSVDATGPYGNQRCVNNTLVKAEVGFNASCPDLHCVFCMLVDRPSHFYRHPMAAFNALSQSSVSPNEVHEVPQA